MFEKKRIGGNAVLFCGDSLKITPILPKVDHVITDPPYEAEAHQACHRTQKSIKNNKVDIIDFAAFTEQDRQQFIAESTRLAQKWVLAFCQVEAAGKYQDYFGSAYKRTMIWVKPDAAPQFNGQKPAQGYECISLAWVGNNGKSVWNGGGKRGVFYHNTNSSTRTGQHQTEKPLKLMKELIKLFTNKGDTILDLYMGSGTTGVAALELGRKFIGIELDPEKYKFACSRIEDTVAATGQIKKSNPKGFLY